jgi:hypothetical protein
MQSEQQQGETLKSSTKQKKKKKKKKKGLFFVFSRQLTVSIFSTSASMALEKRCSPTTSVTASTCDSALYPKKKKKKKQKSQKQFQQF